MTEKKYDFPFKWKITHSPVFLHFLFSVEHRQVLYQTFQAVLGAVLLVEAETKWRDYLVYKSLYPEYSVS